MQTEQLTHEAAQHRYALHLDGKLAAHADYSADAGIVTFTHTEVLPGHEGKGLGSKIAKFALDDVRARGLRVVAQCPFIAAYIGKHAEYAALISS